jgi:glycosyltransferase involved in cell wall biosynthesis
MPRNDRTDAFSVVKNEEPLIPNELIGQAAVVIKRYIMPKGVALPVGGIQPELTTLLKATGMKSVQTKDTKREMADVVWGIAPLQEEWTNLLHRLRTMALASRDLVVILRSAPPPVWAQQMSDYRNDTFVQSQSLASAFREVGLRILTETIITEGDDTDSAGTRGPLLITIGTKRGLRTPLTKLPFVATHYLVAVITGKLRQFLTTRSTGNKFLAAFGGLLPIMSWYAFAFDRYKRGWLQTHTSDLSSLVVPQIKNQASIVLPVYNGEDTLREAVDSIRAQTYRDFELIIVDDGSTDRSGDIADRYARVDRRIRVIHQKNTKLPGALNRGFREARGEFLTWTSSDNRLKPDFLMRMVKELKKNPHWDMTYANVDIIGEDGKPLRQSEWYRGYQSPPGSHHIYLPEDPSELNTYANNYVGAAFLYRPRLPYLIGGYSPRLFTLEDYDYWMRVNALATLCHTRFRNPIYEYRFHGKSLTANDKLLGITRRRNELMVFEDYRRDYYLAPGVWCLMSDGSREAERLAENLRTLIRNAGHILLDRGELATMHLPRLWLPLVVVSILKKYDHRAMVPDAPLPPGACKVLMVAKSSQLPNLLPQGWDMAVTSTRVRRLPMLDNWSGWVASGDLRALFTAIDTRMRMKGITDLETECAAPPKPSLKMSIVICTVAGNQRLIRAVRSAMRQSLPRHHFEIIVVNNNVDTTSNRDYLKRYIPSFFRSSNCRIVDCPLQGLSFARNAGIAEARGEIICFLDDDAVADRRWLAELWSVYTAHPNAGVVGGHAKLNISRPRPKVLKPGWEKYWSQYITEYRGVTELKKWWQSPWGVNWTARREALLRIGGFRGRYGRVGKNFWGGEEIVASSLIRRIGYKIFVAPRAKVLHDVDPSRFTFRHVWKSALAATYVKYAMQQDLYIPRENTLFSGLIALAFLPLRFLGIQVITRLGTINNGTLSPMEFLLYGAAQIRLFVTQMVNTLYRFRPPVALQIRLRK